MGNDIFKPTDFNNKNYNNEYSGRAWQRNFK